MIGAQLAALVRATTSPGIADQPLAGAIELAGTAGDVGATGVADARDAGEPYATDLTGTAGAVDRSLRTRGLRDASAALAAEVCSARVVGAAGAATRPGHAGQADLSHAAGKPRVARRVGAARAACRPYGAVGPATAGTAAAPPTSAAGDQTCGDQSEQQRMALRTPPAALRAG